MQTFFLIKKHYNYKTITTINKLGLIIFSVFLCWACKNDIEVIKNLTEHKKMPELQGEGVEVIYTDSSVVKTKMFTPKIIKISNDINPYYEFPLGIRIYSYNKDKIVISEISAKYAKYDITQRLWHARITVEAKNLQKGEILNTEELYWDEKKEIIYTDKFVKITNKSGVFFGEKGFEADQNMNHWKLFNSRGLINVKDKEKDKDKK